MSDKKFSITDYISIGGLVFVGYVLTLQAIVGAWIMTMLQGS